MSAHSSAASAASTSDCSEPVCASCGSARPIPGGGMCCDGTGPTRPATRTSEAWGSRTDGDERCMTRPVREGIPPLRAHDVTAVSISYVEASPARTSASPADAPDSTEREAPSSSSSHESLSLFAPAGFSSRTYPDYFPLTVAEISPSYSRRWPSSGMAFAGECWTLDSSESPSEGVECSLSDILEPQVPSRFYLSLRAAKGILRRAEKRGRQLPSHLSAALEAVAQTTTTGREDG